jgi:hypothetical protein
MSSRATKKTKGNTMTSVFMITGGICIGLLLWMMLVFVTSLLLPRGVDTFDKAGFVVGLLTYLAGGGVAAWWMM